MSSAEVATQKDKGLVVYLTIGRGLGWLAGAITFVGGWIYCLATYGFLLGGSLGWIPSAIAAAIVGGLVTFLWGPIALASLWWGVTVWGHKMTDGPPDVSVEATDTAQTAFDAATPTATEADPPSPPTVATATQAVADFQRVYWTSNMAGVVTYTMACYDKLKASPSLAQWDLCATVDQLGAMQSADTASRGGAATEYFDPYKVANRQGATNVDSVSSDRVAALKAMLAQAIENQRTAPTPPDQQAAQSQAETATAAVHPTFDCTRVASANLKLICATPTLAAADQELAAAYRTAMDAAPSPETLQESQREWVRRRNAAPADIDGLSSMFAQRTAELRALANAQPAG